MVKIPALELDGQNWKIYRAKLLEHAATKGWLGVLAGEPDNDWEGCNDLLHELLHDTIHISIYIRLRRNTAHQVFKYLAKRFRDHEPIVDPRAKKLATCANEDKRYPSAESPTSENAATGTEREDPPMKDLTRGNEDVDDRIVGRKDLARTSLEASATGNSAESAETTPVVLESTPHETQKPPQDSLQTTPRLPTEGEPSECKQEVTGSVVTAECTKGTVQSANLPETDADVDRKATLGREPAETVCGVDEGDKERDNESRLQQTNFYCKEDRQHDENVNADVPSAHRLPLEGEWTVRASGGLTNSSEGCERGAVERECVDEPIVECCQQLCVADGDPGRGVEPTDTPNESRTLVTRSIESESPDNGSIPRVHLGSTSRRAGDANGAGHGADGSTGETNGSRGQTDALRASNKAETDSMSDGEDAGTYLDARGAKRVVNAMDGVGSQSDASREHWDVSCVETDAYTTANATETVSIPPKPKKPPDLPGKGARWAPDEPNGYGTRADTFSVRRDTYHVGNDTETPANAPENVSIPREKAKPPDSPFGTTRMAPDEPNGVGDHTDGSGGHRDVPSVETDARTTANDSRIIRTRRNGPKTQNSPMETAKRTPGVPNGCGSHADASSVRTHAHCIGNETDTAAGEAERVRTHQIKSRT